MQIRSAWFVSSYLKAATREVSGLPKPMSWFHANQFALLFNKVQQRGTRRGWTKGLIFMQIKDDELIKWKGCSNFKPESQSGCRTPASFEIMQIRLKCYARSDVAVINYSFQRWPGSVTFCRMEVLLTGNVNLTQILPKFHAKQINLSELSF